MNVGFIGLGSQGEPMARRAETLAPFAGSGAVSAPSIAALAAQCAHVGVCVVDDARTQEACDALIPALRPLAIFAAGQCIYWLE